MLPAEDDGEQAGMGSTRLLWATFATHALQGGIDLRTVQAWTGHTDLASTMRYLRRPARRVSSRILPSSLKVSVLGRWFLQEITSDLLRIGSKPQCLDCALLTVFLQHSDRAAQRTLDSFRCQVKS